MRSLSSLTVAVILLFCAASTTLAQGDPNLIQQPYNLDTGLRHTIEWWKTRQ